MIVWTPIAFEKPSYRYPTPHSATVIGTSVVLRISSFGIVLPTLSFALTTIPFPSASEAAAWIEAHRDTQGKA